MVTGRDPQTAATATQHLLRVFILVNPSLIWNLKLKCSFLFKDFCLLLIKKYMLNVENLEKQTKI